MSQFGQIRPRESVTGRERLRDLPATRVIPYEYVARFNLTGNVGNLIQDVINISVEGTFVAVSVGYGLDEARAEPLGLLTGSGRVPSGQPTLGEITLDNIPPDVLIEGFRIDPSFAAIAVQNERLNEALPFNVAQGVFQRLKQTENFSFLFSIVDTATGRELQNEPVHSVATLGRADGRRPFKMLPQPMVFMPRSTIRLQVEESTARVKGRLFITLQGYKVLGMAGGLEDEARRMGEFDPLKRIPVYDHETGSYRPLGEALQQDIPSSRVVPFDYVSTLELTGTPGNIAEDEAPINVDGGYVTTAIGYSLDRRDASVQVVLDPPDTTPLRVSLKNIKLSDLRPAQALLDGIRIHPLRVKFAFGSAGELAQVDRDMVADKDNFARIFQRLNRPDDVRFLYAFSDSGTGRDLQNLRVLNVAGLGIANGDRPFKVLHKPMSFLPRSTIRVQVEEIFGRGRLFIVFQGYKVLA